MDATSNNQITIYIDGMSAKGLGINGLKVDGADDAINEAIRKVSTQRSALSAVQNRQEHTINNLDNVVENTTVTESRIRDTDMATGMVKYYSERENVLSKLSNEDENRQMSAPDFFLCVLKTKA